MTPEEQDVQKKLASSKGIAWLGNKINQQIIACWKEKTQT